MRSAVFFLALAAMSQTCRAGGTVDFSYVDGLLQQRPEIRTVLLSSLLMPGDAYAQVRLGSHFTNLGGARLGPYTFDATPKGKAGPSVQVTLCTTPLLLDATGKTVEAGNEQYLSATSVRELLNSVVLRAAGTSGAASCP